MTTANLTPAFTVKGSRVTTPDDTAKSIKPTNIPTEETCWRNQTENGGNGRLSYSSNALVMSIWLACMVSRRGSTKPATTTIKATNQRGRAAAPPMLEAQAIAVARPSKE